MPRTRNLTGPGREGLFLASVEHMFEHVGLVAERGKRSATGRRRLPHGGVDCVAPVATPTSGGRRVRCRLTRPTFRPPRTA